MSKSNNKAIRSVASVTRRLGAGAKRVGTGLVLAGMSAAASAQTAPDMPTDLATAATFMQEKGAIALAVAAVVTLIVLGLKGAKLPRRA